MLLAIAGVVLARSHERNLALLGWPLYGTLLCAVSLGHPRLRLPLLITAFVYAALPLAHPRLLWQRLRTAVWPRRVVLLVGIMLFALLLYARVYIPFVPSQAWLSVAHLGGGAPAIERAIAAMPDSYLPYVALGDHLRSQGKAADALHVYNHAATLAPQNSYVNVNRLDLLRYVGDEAGAHEAMDVIAAFGWDSNQLYQWAWEHLPATATSHLDMIEPAPGVLRGFYPAEHKDERTVRWTMEQAQMRLLPPDETPFEVVLVLRADNAQTPVQLFYQGASVTTLYVGTAWQQFVVEVAPGHQPPDQQPGVLELRVPTHVVGVDTPYPRGVAVDEVWVRE